ncbi:MAG TPA: tetratricopeptide repeat protein [Myxococcota bacterium]|nr:tetratricopeptide repeat protein [Myxococcota bacterium]
MRWFPRAFGGDARAPRNTDSALREALLSVLDRNLDRAEGALAELAREPRSEAFVFLALGKLYRARGEVGRAIQIHQHLLLRNDVSASERLAALSDLAEDFRRGGFLRRAIASFEEVLAHDSRNEPALRALVGLYADVRDHAAALALERRLGRLEGRGAAPAEASRLVEMADAAHAEGRTAHARRAVRRALRRDSRNVRAWVLLGVLEAELGRPKHALAAWRRVPTLDPRSGPEVYARLAATFALLGRPREHETFLQGILLRVPDDAGARLALARALASRGETELALLELRRVLEREPNHWEAHYELGHILLTARRERDALGAYAELLQRLEQQGFRPRETSE